MDEAFRRMSAEVRRPAKRRSWDLAVVTFDDGYVGVYEQALPVLRELHIPAVVYVPTGYVGTCHRLLHDRLHASLLELRARRTPRGRCGLEDRTPARACAMCEEQRAGHPLDADRRHAARLPA